MPGPKFRAPLGALLCFAVLCSAFTKEVERPFPGRGSTADAATGRPNPAAHKVRTAQFGSGLPVPRWVSLKADRINVRRGASLDHEVLWTYRRDGLPVEIIGEFYTWRRIRDQSGDVGWVKQQMLSSRRSVIVTGKDSVALLERPSDDSEPLALAKPGLVAELSGCAGHWCKISAKGYEGFVPRVRLWGIYGHEHSLADER